MYVFERDILRGGDDDRTAEGHGLGKGELCIARAGGEIDDEVVERAPYYVNHELLNHSAHDGTAPYYGGIFSGDEAERHEFDIVIFKGQYFLTC